MEPQITEQPIVVKKTRNRIAKTGTSVDAKELVQKLTNQAAVVMWIDNVQVPEILDTLVTDKECRDTMIRFQKAITQAKNEAIISIQKL